MLIIVAFFGVKAGYAFINDVVIPENKSHVEFNDWLDYKDINYAYFTPDDVYILNKTQMALPNTKILLIRSISNLPDSLENPLFLPKRKLGELIVQNRISLDDFMIRRELAVVNQFSRGSNILNMPLSIFQTSNGIFDNNTIVSDGNAGHLVFGSYITLVPGTYLFTAHLNLINPGDMYDDLGCVDFVSVSALLF